MSTTTEVEPVVGAAFAVPRCTDCDEDCWDVTNKLKCWLGGGSGPYYTPIADGFCPWLHDGVPLPPKP